MIDPLEVDLNCVDDRILRQCAHIELWAISETNGAYCPAPSIEAASFLSLYGALHERLVPLHDFPVGFKDLVRIRRRCALVAFEARTIYVDRTTNIPTKS